MVLVGAAYFLADARERRLQGQEAGEDMTFLDAIYFATVNKRGKK